MCFAKSIVSMEIQSWVNVFVISSFQVDVSFGFLHRIVLSSNLVHVLDKEANHHPVSCINCGSILSEFNRNCIVVTYESIPAQL
jgi:hypothetical protein